MDMASERIGGEKGFVGTLLRCRLTYNGDAGHAPASVIVKLPARESKAKTANKLLALSKREFDFYGELSRDGAIPAPEMYYGEIDKRRRNSVLVLEDVGHMKMLNRFDVVSEEQAKTAIRAIARLHGRFWEKHKQPPLSGFYNFHGWRQRAIVNLAYPLCAGPILKRFGHVITNDTRRLIDAYPARLDQQILDNAALPQTVVHGDYHQANLAFGPDRPDQMSAMDWQGCGISNGMQDVFTFLLSSLSIEMRRKMERGLLEEYHAIVCGMGVQEYTFDDCWNSYRQFMLFGLVLVVLLFGRVVNERDPEIIRLGELVLDRLQAAINDLRADELMPGLPRFWTPSKAISVAMSGTYGAGKLLRRIPKPARGARA